MLILSLLLSCAKDLGCVEAYGEYEKEIGPHTCCEGSVPISRNIGIWTGTKPFEGEGYPEGCGPVGGEAVVCLPCGDGTCGDEENYCNCPEDCAAPKK